MDKVDNTNEGRAPMIQEFVGGTERQAMWMVGEATRALQRAAEEVYGEKSESVNKEELAQRLADMFKELKPDELQKMLDEAEEKHQK